MLELMSGLIGRLGAVAIGLLMFLENVFPPIPSELIMPLAGYEAAKGRVSLFGVLVWGALGSLAGAALWYWIGLRLGAGRVRRIAERHGRWLTVTPAQVDRAHDWFARHGGKTVLVGRLLPTVRTLISVPAGIARMDLRRFLVFSAIGTATWSSALALAGYVLGARFDRVATWLGPFSTAVVVLLVAVYLWRVATFSSSPRRD